ncbi:DUF3618 domain-containing protein [Arenibaculum pallidiluteum]|uniref:DUF3618 domain-containing protein n=1 Tax=Arenibaculum pallidiluteum TaxID=2812559 RepID=UPI001A97768C|nr:DUF3618 domain-containing protein [Arenibaculum pallidiluteum]
MSRTDEINPDSDRQGQARSRSPADIERDIAAARERMDRTLDEIEYRLSPGQMTASVRDTLRDIVEGNPQNRLAMAIRNNPIPVALIGIGAIWLAFAAMREGQRVSGPTTVSGPAAASLARLAVAVREGALALRDAASATTDAAFGGLLDDYAREYERAAAVIDGEMRTHAEGAADRAADGAGADGAGTGAEPASAAGMSWGEVRRVAATHDRTALLSAARQGSSVVLDAFRDTLRHDLPEPARIAVGAQFHAMEQVHNRLASLDTAT